MIYKHDGYWHHIGRMLKTLNRKRVEVLKRMGPRSAREARRALK